MGNRNTDVGHIRSTKKGYTYLVGYIQQKAGKTLLTRLERDIY